MQVQNRQGYEFMMDAIRPTRGKEYGIFTGSKWETANASVYCLHRPSFSFLTALARLHSATVSLSKTLNHCSLQDWRSTADL